jgi:hypothetical protein
MTVTGVTPGEVVRCGVAVLRRPSLWPTALRQFRRGVPARWWARRPFLPLPPAAYVRFRLQTQYGSGQHHIAAADVLNYLSWCRRQRAVGS